MKKFFAVVLAALILMTMLVVGISVLAREIDPVVLNQWGGHYFELTACHHELEELPKRVTTISIDGSIILTVNFPLEWEPIFCGGTEHLLVPPIP